MRSDRFLDQRQCGHTVRHATLRLRHREHWPAKFADGLPEGRVERSVTVNVAMNPFYWALIGQHLEGAGSQRVKEFGVVHRVSASALVGREEAAAVAIHYGLRVRCRNVGQRFGVEVTWRFGALRVRIVGTHDKEL